VKPEVGDSDDLGFTVVLSPPLERDTAAIARWYDKATMLAGSSIPLGKLVDTPAGRRVFVLTDGVNQAPVGVMAAVADDPEPGWTTVDLLAVAGQERRDAAAWAVVMLEAYVKGEADHIRATVSGDVGLALYFWLRLGYRPIVSGRQLWMMRELEA
jgi:hypothetical protein